MGEVRGREGGEWREVRRGEGRNSKRGGESRRGGLHSFKSNP